MYQLTNTKEEKKLRAITYKGIRYLLEQKDTKFILYSPDNLEVEVGEAAIKDGNPTLPITLY